MTAYRVTYRQVITTVVILDADTATEAECRVETEILHSEDLHFTDIIDWEQPDIIDTVEVDMIFSREAASTNEWVPVADLPPATGESVVYLEDLKVAPR